MIRMTKKQRFIGEFIEREMMGHNLPYSIEYLNRVADAERNAIKAWKERSGTIPKQ